MATILESFGSSGQTLTCTLASLVTNTERQSTPVDNTATLFDDVLVMLKVKSGASGTLATGTVRIYVFGTVDGGTTYTEGAGAADAAITLTSPPNAKIIGTINVVANATTYIGGPFSIAQVLGCVPAKWGIIVENQSGATLDATEGNFAKLWQGVSYTVA